MSTADEYKQLGNQYFAAKDFENAINAYTKAIELKEDHVYYSNRSACYASIRKFEDALNDAECCLSVKSDFVKGYSRKAAALYGLGRLEDAIGAYESSLKLDPSQTSAEEEIARIKQELNAPPPMANPFASMFGPDMLPKLAANPKTRAYVSQPDFLQIMQKIAKEPNSITQYLTDPRVGEALQVLLGMNLSGNQEEEPQQQQRPPQQQQQQQQQQQYQRPPPPQQQQQQQAASVSNDDDDSEIEVDEDLEREKKERAELKAKADKEKELGTVAYKQKDFATALKHYTAAFETVNDAVYLMNITAVYYEMKDYTACISKCAEILSNRGYTLNTAQKAKVLVRKANAHKALAQYDEAISAFKSSLLEESIPAVRKQLREVEEAKKKAEAEAYLDENLSEELKIKGNEAVKEGNWPVAIELYTDSLKRNPANYKVYANRALCFQKLMRWDKCIEDCDKCISFDKTFGKAYLRKGKVLHYLKNYPKALECYRLGLELSPVEFHAELNAGINETQNAIYANSTGEVDEQRVAEAMRDPEIVHILQDPMMQQILGEMQTKPELAQKYMQTPEVSSRLEKLIAAGIIRLG